MTIRDNILFGCPYDSTRYEQVLFACALNEVCLYFVKYSFWKINSDTFFYKMTVKI